MNFASQNRAARRGNVVRARRTPSAILGVMEAHQERSGKTNDPGARAFSDDDYGRDELGRFTAAKVSAPNSVVQVETRQQRRYAERQAAKKGVK